MTLHCGHAYSQAHPQAGHGVLRSGPDKALRVKAAETERSLSELVNAAVRQSLAEDSEDLAAFEARAGEPSLAFADVLKDLKRRGKL